MEVTLQPTHTLSLISLVKSFDRQLWGLNLEPLFWEGGVLTCQFSQERLFPNWDFFLHDGCPLHFLRCHRLL